MNSDIFEGMQMYYYYYETFRYFECNYIFINILNTVARREKQKRKSTLVYIVLYLVINIISYVSIR